jgi:hypothetical protein
MFNTSRGTERVALLAVISPVSQAAGTVTTAWLPMSTFGALLAVVQAGALGNAATVDAKMQQAKDVSGTAAKDVTGRALTQLTQAGTDKSNKQALINLRAVDLDVAGGFSHARLSLTVATAASLVSAVVLGLAPRAGLASKKNAASVDQIVGG